MRGQKRAPAPPNGVGRRDDLLKQRQDHSQANKNRLTAQARRDAQFERDVERLHSLGPRAVGELLLEIGRDTMRMTEIERRVAGYARLDVRTVCVLGADRWPPRLWRAA